MFEESCFIPLVRYFSWGPGYGDFRHYKNMLCSDVRGGSIKAQNTFF